MHVRFGVVAPLALIAACTGDISVANKANVEPAVVISGPRDGSTFSELDTIELTGILADGNGLDDIQTHSWTSDLQGLLAENGDINTGGTVREAVLLDQGTHVITLKAIDSGGLTDEASISLIVEQASVIPSAEITSPVNNTSHEMQDALSMSGTVYDPNGLAGLTVMWTVEPEAGGIDPLVIFEGAPSGAGATTAVWDDIDALGTYRITLTVEDPDGNTDSDDRLVTIVDALDGDSDGDGWSPNQGDCNDNDGSVNPGEDEVCNNVDDDCNNVVDDKDLDGDTHVDSDCADHYPGPKAADDCDDENSTIYPGATERIDGLDNDCDGDVDQGTTAWDEDGDCVCVVGPCTGSSNAACVQVVGGDCDDTDPLNFPGNPEVCDGADNDCDNAPDNGLTFVSYWADVDVDGFGDEEGVPTSTCAGQPPGMVPNADDCADDDVDVNPDAIEMICDNVDNDCDPLTTDGPDGDSDGVAVCGGDCDDNDPLRFPGNPEICDGIDNDCSGVPDDGGVVFTDWFPDNDTDGFGTGVVGGQYACQSPLPGWVSNDADCDDNDIDVNPDGVEIP